MEGISTLKDLLLLGKDSAPGMAERYGAIWRFSCVW